MHESRIFSFPKISGRTWATIIFVSVSAQCLLSVACTASLPRLPQNWAKHSSLPVHFEDGRGPLSREQSAAIYNNLSRFGEVNAVVLGPEFAGQMQAMFKHDLTESNAIELDRWEQRSLILRVKERFARLWEYWL